MNPQDWIGRTQSATAPVTAFPAQALAATLGHERDFTKGMPLPLLWHWLFAHSPFPISQAGADGHQALGHFLPPLTLPRRMWAGSRFRFHAPLRLGDIVTRYSTVQAIAEKSGATGPICFVTVKHDWQTDSRTLLSEEQDIVYRAADAPTAKPRPAPETADFSGSFQADALTLFRYSALTFNGHRIHYDADFCKAEGYGGLVVHGPLLATQLLESLTRQSSRTPNTFGFRAVMPVLAGQTVTLGGCHEKDETHLWIRHSDGSLAMEGWATF